MAYDPFQRTRYVPFSIAGRRQTISVMTTLESEDEEDSDNGKDGDNKPSNKQNESRS